MPPRGAGREALDSSLEPPGKALYARARPATRIGDGPISGEPIDARTLKSRPEVAAALAEGRPVVALESTLIAHGLPWPENLETARDPRRPSATPGPCPATSPCSRARSGWASTATNWSGSPRRAGIVRSRPAAATWAAVAARGLDAATTVSATLWIARSVGIGAMATGGLGGVHRGAAETFDVSTDLDELARADGMLVVCSGVKSILDVPATLEAMETRGDRGRRLPHERRSRPSPRRRSGLADRVARRLAGRGGGDRGGASRDGPARRGRAGPAGRRGGRRPSRRDGRGDRRGAGRGRGREGSPARRSRPFLLDSVREATGGAGASHRGNRGRLIVGQLRRLRAAGGREQRLDFRRTGNSNLTPPLVRHPGRP